MTAAQYPLEYPYTDGFNNLYGACQVALGDDPSSNVRNGHFYPEVLVFINNTIFLGSRVRKANASEMDAFESSVGRRGVWAESIHVNKTSQEVVLISRLKVMVKNILRYSNKIIDNSILEGLLLDQSQFSSSDNSNIEYYANLAIVDYITNSETPYAYRGYPSCIDLAWRALLRAYSDIEWDQSSEDKRIGMMLPIAQHGVDTVYSMKLSPMEPDMIVATLDMAYGKGIRFFVIEAFGSGNGPSVIGDWFNNKDLDDKNARAYLAIVTQCSKGFVSTVYDASLGKVARNVARCRDMTIESAVGKLWVMREYAFSNASSDPNRPNNSIKLMEVSLRGELMNDSVWY